MISLSLSPSFLFIYLCFFYPIVVYIASTCIVEFYNVPRKKKKKKKNRYGFIPRFINFRLFSLSPLSLSFHCLRFTMKTITRFVLFLFCFLCTISFFFGGRERGEKSFLWNESLYTSRQPARIAWILPFIKLINKLLSWRISFFSSLQLFCCFSSRYAVPSFSNGNRVIVSLLRESFCSILFTPVFNFAQRFARKLEAQPVSTASIRKKEEEEEENDCRKWLDEIYRSPLTEKQSPRNRFTKLFFF